MKFSLTQSIAFPIVLGTFVGVGGAIFALQQSFSAIHTKEIGIIAENMSEDVVHDFVELERTIYEKFGRFSGTPELRKYIYEDDKLNAVNDFILLMREILPLEPSIGIIKRTKTTPWLKSTDVFEKYYDPEVIEYISTRKSDSPNEIIRTHFKGAQSLLLVFSAPISAPNTFDAAGSITIVYEFGPGSELQDYLRKTAHLSCISVVIDENPTIWNGNNECQEENTFIDPQRINAGEDNYQYIDHNIYSISRMVSSAYPNLKLIGTKPSTIYKNQENQMYWTIMFASASVLIAGLGSMFASSLLMRKSIKSLLSFIGEDILVHNKRAPDYSISEFNEIARTHENAKNQLLKLNTKLQDTNRGQAEITYAISHDIKSPIITIQMLLSELEVGYNHVLGDEGNAIVHDLKQTADRMIKLIDSVQSYARSIGEIKVVDHETLDLNVIVKEILSDHQGEIKAIDAKVTVSDLPSINANDTQIRILLQNLISNAIKFRVPDKAPIVKIYGQLETTKDGEKVTISIEDNGIGIPKEFQDRVFGLFKRLHNYNSYEGSGIGLAVCHRIIRNHNGDITLTSEERKGTTFKVVLPR